MVLFQARGRSGDTPKCFCSVRGRLLGTGAGRRMFVSLVKGRGAGEGKFTCLLCNLSLAVLGSWGVLLLVWGELKPGTWACFETGQIPAGSAGEVPCKNLWGGKVLAACELERL